MRSDLDNTDDLAPIGEEPPLFDPEPQRPDPDEGEGI
jgi:hypothetical protein